jgi:CheY-like chemotaxis protein
VSASLGLEAPQPVELGDRRPVAVLPWKGALLHIVSRILQASSLRLWVTMTTDDGAASDATTTTHVLVVDDDVSLRRLIERALVLEGYSVAVAGDGAAALARIRERRPALILLDLQMPGMDGWQFREQLRAAGQAIPIVVMTSLYQAPPSQDGMAAYLAKPFALEDLLDAVARMVGVSDS